MRVTRSVILATIFLFLGGCSKSVPQPKSIVSDIVTYNVSSEEEAATVKRVDVDLARSTADHDQGEGNPDRAIGASKEEGRHHPADSSSVSSVSTNRGIIRHVPKIDRDEDEERSSIPRRTSDELLLLDE